MRGKNYMHLCIFYVFHPHPNPLPLAGEGFISYVKLRLISKLLLEPLAMSQISRQEKRIHNRIAFDAPVVISIADRQWQSNLLDISLKGALVNIPDDWDNKPDSHCQLDIQLSGSDIHIQMQVSVKHIENNHIGFQCEQIDLDSISNLRRLVELNMLDESALERELAALAHGL